MKSNRKKRNTGLLLLLLLLTVTIGFALLSTTLKINGFADIKGNKWDVRWDDESVAVTEGSVTAEAPTVTESDTKVSFSVSLALPGDFYEFTIDAINAGTIDAMIEDIKTTIKDGDGEPATLPSYINFSVTYSDGVEVAEGHLLAKRTDATHPTRETYKVRIEFDEEAEAIPETDSRYVVTYDVKYQQADDTAINRNSNISAGTGAYFDPVSSARCDEYTYDASDAENGDSTCYKWNVIGTSGRNITLQLDHDLIDSEWLSNADYNYIEGVASTTSTPKVSKLGDLDKEIKATRISYDSKYGPYTLMKNLAEATANWERVPLITSYTHTPTMKVATGTTYTEKFETVTIEHGVYQTGSNAKSRVENVRARVISVDDIARIVAENDHTLADYQGQGEHQASFVFANDENLQWLYDNYSGSYWMMTQGYDDDGAWRISDDAFYSSSNHTLGMISWGTSSSTTGVRPVITVPKKNVVIVE